VESLITKHLHGFEYRLRRVGTSPFRNRFERPLIIHSVHHKAGTVWFQQVLLSVANSYGLRFQIIPKTIRPETDFVLTVAGQFEWDQIAHRPFRGSHVIRDPRDLVVSGYEYHKVTREKWCRTPNPRRAGGLSYQDYLLSLNEHDGLMAEVEYVARRTAKDMAQWDYEQTEFLELRYEDAMIDSRATFERLFAWYGFTDRATEIGLEATERLSLGRGGAIANHVRSGTPGEWKTRLSADHIERFKELTGDLVVRLGYETSEAWGAG